MCASVFSITTANASTYAWSGSSKSPGLHSQWRAANRSTSRSIFCASPGTRNGLKKTRSASSSAKPRKSCASAYAFITRSASTSCEPSSSPTALGSSWVQTRPEVVRFFSSETSSAFSFRAFARSTGSTSSPKNASRPTRNAAARFGKRESVTSIVSSSMSSRKISMTVASVVTEGRALNADVAASNVAFRFFSDANVSLSVSARVSETDESVSSVSS